MANIMMTDVCNLRCPYCFANEFVNKDANEISMENFKKALEFIATEKCDKLGLIGGEPTLHSKMKEILQLLINDERFTNVVLFTNGVKIDEYVDELSHPKFKVLVNCNSVADIGEKAYKKMCENLDLFIEKRYLKDRITLGINIYEQNFEYDYILKLLKKYGYNRVRMSIVVPNTAGKRDMDVKGYFRSVKPRFMEFVKTMLANGILPTYDCNKMPACLISCDDRAMFDSMLKAETERRIKEKLPPVLLPNSDSAIYTEEVHCSPVIDVLQDLTAVRCFGLSDCTKVRIADFKTITDLKNYYLNEIDSYAFKTGISHGCAECYRRKTLKCMGGCIAFKIEKIKEMREQSTKYLQGE